MEAAVKREKPADWHANVPFNEFSWTVVCAENILNMPYGSDWIKSIQFTEKAHDSLLHNSNLSAHELHSAIKFCFKKQPSDASCFLWLSVVFDVEFNPNWNKKIWK